MPYEFRTDPKLVDMYIGLNSDFFDGKLPTIPIGWAKMKTGDESCRAFTHYDEPLAIVFNVALRKLYRSCETHLAFTLLHEMLHVKLADAHRRGAKPHGRLFEKEMLRVLNNRKIKDIF